MPGIGVWCQVLLDQLFRLVILRFHRCHRHNPHRHHHHQHLSPFLLEQRASKVLDISNKLLQFLAFGVEMLVFCWAWESAHNSLTSRTTCEVTRPGGLDIGLGNSCIMALYAHVWGMRRRLPHLCVELHLKNDQMWCNRTWIVQKYAVVTLFTSLWQHALLL